MDRKFELPPIGFAVAASLFTACATARPAQAPSAPSVEGFITPKPVVATPKLDQPIEYLNDDGALVVSKGNEMTVSKDGLSVTVSCVPGGVAFSTQTQGLADSESYRLAVLDPVLGVSGREETVSAGMGNQAVRTSFDRDYGTITGTGDGRPKKILPGKQYTFSLYKAPNSTPVTQVRVLTPDRC